MNSLLIVPTSTSSIKPKIDAHANLGQIVHRLFAADFLGRAQNSEGAADIIMQDPFGFD